MNIHPTAIVSKDAHLGSGVEVHPYAIIEPGVTIGDGTIIYARAQVCTGTTMGKNCRIHMNAVVGYVPQDFAYKGGPITTIVGDDVTLRENGTIHGSHRSATQVGDGCYLMVGTHVAHDCRLGKKVLIANGSQLAGHIEIDDHAIISGNVTIHQFVRIGRLAICSGASRVAMDVPPYLIADGTNAVTTLNKVGMRRATWLTDQDRLDIKKAYKIIYRSDLYIKDAIARLKEEFTNPVITHWVDFLEAPSKRGFCRYRSARRGINPNED